MAAIRFGECETSQVLAVFYFSPALFLPSFFLSFWVLVEVMAWYLALTNPARPLLLLFLRTPTPLAGSQCAGLFSTTVLGGSSSAPNLQDYARAHRKKFSTGSLSYKDGMCLNNAYNSHRTGQIQIRVTHIHKHKDFLLATACEAFHSLPPGRGKYKHRG